MTGNGKEKAGTSLPTVFKFGENKLETIIINDEPCFIAKDVCDILGIKNSRQAINGNIKSGALGLDDDEKLMYRIYTSGQNRETTMVNESGLYSLIFQSNRPEARAFRKWVTSEVLPAIRQKRLYGQVATIGGLRKKCETISFNDTTLYAYRDVQRQLGYSTKTSTSNIKRLYGGQVATIGRKCFVSEMYVKLMVQRATAREAAKDTQLALPLVSADFGTRLLF